MLMRLFVVVLAIVLLLLQYRLWISGDGVRGVARLEQAVAQQQQENAQLRARNEQLAAEVKDLKEGMTAVEERARSDLGMVGANESFYQVVSPDPAEAAASESKPDKPAQSSKQAAAR